jgi:uncharacterized protein
MRRCLFLLALLFVGLSSQTGRAQTEPLATAIARAEQNDAAAQFTLAERYRTGDGLLQDHAIAAQWYARAAALDHAPAQNQLGKSYYEGLGVPQDAAQALRWLSAAADQGAAQHIFDLAIAVEKGAADTAPDPEQAARLYATAAEAGHTEAAVNLGVLYQNGVGVVQDYGRALTLYEAPAAAGHARAQNNLGLLYVRGTGVVQDYERAASLFAAAAEQGLTEAMRNLGVMYDNGFGVPQSDELASQWYRQAGQSGQTVDQVSLLPIYDPRLMPPPKDNLPALQQAAEAGDPVAQFMTGWLMAAQGNPAFDRAATRWFRAAADKGHGPAMFNLGLFYFLGRGLPQDYVLAQMWLVLAASAGFEVPPATSAALQKKMTSDQINDAQSRARKRWQRSLQPKSP